MIVTQGSMRGQRLTLLLVVLVSLVASQVTGQDRNLRRRARHRASPGLSSDNGSLDQVLLTMTST